MVTSSLLVTAYFSKQSEKLHQMKIQICHDNILTLKLCENTALVVYTSQTCTAGSTKFYGYIWTWFGKGKVNI